MLVTSRRMNENETQHATQPNAKLKAGRHTAQKQFQALHWAKAQKHVNTNTYYLK